MPSFADSIFLFALALLLFGPKKLPVLARELGKWVGEFRRASNEFKMQMEEELRQSEQAERQKQIAAMEAAAPLPPPLDEPEHPHLPRPANIPDPETAAAIAQSVTLEEAAGSPAIPAPSASAQDASSAESAEGVRPIPIATSGDLRMMPPATGLPTPRGRNTDSSAGEDPLGGLLQSIPGADTAEPAFAHHALDETPETAAHGD